ncbi:MAG: MurR/RpiR family transcriptional regulator [Clostridiales bacterium]|nr:MurR/RpiR family transcriptional regulator [Clostridiales bacterium]
MNCSDFLLKINTRYNLFTKAERKVADFVLQNPRKVLFMSITDLADACSVGDTSVFRFCKTMHLQGYQEFKMQLSLSIGGGGDEDEDNPGDPCGRISQSDTLDILAKKVLQTNQSALNETYALLNMEDLSAAVDFLIDARQIYFFGVGASMVTAMDAMIKFLRVTPNVNCVEDSHMQAMAASLLTPQDVAVVISYSGSTKDSIQVAQAAKRAGAKIIAVTRFAKSPLTAHADVIMLCGSNEGPLQGGSTSVKVSQLFLLDLLYMEYFRRTFERSTENKKKTAEAVVDKLY